MLLRYTTLSGPILHISILPQELKKQFIIKFCTMSQAISAISGGAQDTFVRDLESPSTERNTLARKESVTRRQARIQPRDADDDELPLDAMALLGRTVTRVRKVARAKGGEGDGGDGGDGSDDDVPTPLA
jgi:hypothetical protein